MLCRHQVCCRYHRVQLARREALECAGLLPGRQRRRKAEGASLRLCLSHSCVLTLQRTQPDPLIYNTACAKLGLKASECIVIEDSTVGLKAATAAGMRCIITYTSTGKGEPFAEAAFVVNNLDVGGVTVQKLLEAHASNARFDDRK